jgi:hypothetical protein
VSKSASVLESIAAIGAISSRATLFVAGEVILSDLLGVFSER